MQQYNKTTAAVIAGAVVTILIAITNVYSDAMALALKQPGVQAALQTLITAIVVYAAPANK
jgi:hypothetical protein